MASHWLKPPLVSAPDWRDRNRLVTLEVSDHYLDCNAAVFRHTPVFQTWAHVVGEPPPIPNISRVMKGPLAPTLMTLEDSIACFRGVKRPYDDEMDGSSVLIYVLNPKFSLDFEPDLVCLAKGLKVPANTCLTVQVKPYKVPLQRHDHLVEGVVTRSEFVLGEGDPTLPRGHAARYLEQMWRKP